MKQNILKRRRPVSVTTVDKFLKSKDFDHIALTKEAVNYLVGEINRLIHEDGTFWKRDTSVLYVAINRAARIAPKLSSSTSTSKKITVDEESIKIELNKALKIKDIKAYIGQHYPNAKIPYSGDFRTPITSTSVAEFIKVNLQYARLEKQDVNGKKTDRAALTAITSFVNEMNLGTKQIEQHLFISLRNAAKSSKTVIRKKTVVTAEMVLDAMDETDKIKNLGAYIEKHHSK
jgi:hypothetical protein